MVCETLCEAPGLRDLHQQLAEVLALEKAKERGRRVLQALDYVLVILDAAPAHPFAHIAQEIRLPAAKSQTMKPRRVRRLRSTKNMSGPGIGVVALYWEVSPHTRTRAKSLRATIGTSIRQGETNFTTPRLADKLLPSGPFAAGTHAQLSRIRRPLPIFMSERPIRLFWLIVGRYPFADYGYIKADASHIAEFPVDNLVNES